jgi:hypothetical protein
VEANLEAPVDEGVAPEPVVDTEEVAAAKAEFQKTFEEVAARNRFYESPFGPENFLDNFLQEHFGQNCKKQHTSIYLTMCF